jgi:hypothetical protein
MKPTHQAIVACVLALCVVSTAKAHAGESPFDVATRELAQGHCANAVVGFEKLLHERGWSTSLYYNLGRAYACEDKPGRAVLSYERARLLAPHDDDVHAGLVAAQTAAGVSTPEGRWYEKAAHAVTIGAWTWIATAGLWLAVVALFVRKRSRWLLRAAVAFLIVCIVSVGAIAALDGALSDGILIAAGSTPVRLSPFDTATVEHNAREGERVRMLERHGSYTRVRDGEGSSGWIDSAAVEPIVPTRS